MVGFHIGVGYACVRKEHVTGQVAKVVHDIVDAEVVAVTGVRICRIRHLVQRDLTHTVDGVIGIVSHRRHTVLCSLQHEAAAEHTHHVGTLDGVDQAAFIDVLHIR